MGLALNQCQEGLIPSVPARTIGSRLGVTPASEAGWSRFDSYRPRHIQSRGFDPHHSRTPPGDQRTLVTRRASVIEYGRNLESWQSPADRA
jgi:hypothetical protein